MASASLSVVASNNKERGNGNAFLCCFDCQQVVVLNRTLVGRYYSKLSPAEKFHQTRHEYIFVKTARRSPYLKKKNPRKYYTFRALAINLVPNSLLEETLGNLRSVNYVVSFFILDLIIPEYRRVECF